MLELTLPEVEGYDENTGTFVAAAPAVTLRLEHNLVAISKWESKFKKPFFSKESKTEEESNYYIWCMDQDSGHALSLYFRLTDADRRAIQEYIADPHTATVINDRRETKQHAKSFTSSETIYAAMTARGIDWSAQYWHINRLLTLIRLIDVGNSKGDKHNRMSAKDNRAERARILAENRKRFNTRG